MSESKHIYFSTATAVLQKYIHTKKHDNDVRYTPTSGPEWQALSWRVIMHLIATDVALADEFIKYFEEELP